MTTPPRPRGPQGTHTESFLSRHATGVTVTVFVVATLALALAPDVPERLRPIDLTTAEKRVAVVERILKKPRMTFAIPEPEAAPADDELEPPEPAEPGPAVADATPPSADPPAVPDDEAALVAVEPTRTPPPEVGLARAPRVAMATTKASTTLDKLAQGLQALGATIENPCVRPAGDTCARTALDPLFQALDDVAARVEGSHVNILTLGNSLIASDHVTDIVRERLVERFGDGGRGFLLPDRLGSAGRRVRTGMTTPSWDIHTFAQKPSRRPIFGFTGSSHESRNKGDRTTWALKGANHARLFFLDHTTMPGFKVDVDGVTVATVTSNGADADRTLDLELPAGAKALSVVADGPAVVLFGVALTKNDPGVSWDTIGVPASDAAMYLSVDEGLFTRQLQAREPQAVVVMIGGNEIRSLAYRWVTVEDVRRDYGALLERVRAAVPDAACLAVAPIDAAKATAAGAELSTRKETFDVVKLEREVALEKGCAFFDLFTAMGGDGALARFHRKGFVHEDLVHPKGKGGDILGQLFARALFESYQATPPPKDTVASRRRLVPPRLVGLSFPQPGGGAIARERSLPHVVDVIERFGTGTPERFAVALFGDEQIAEQAFPDRVKERLALRYGDRGRGLVGFGFRDKALLRGRVVRRMRGPVEILDGRRVVLGGAMSVFGTTARLAPRARAEITFCDGCKSSTVQRPGTLAVSWLFTPEMGAADVYVNDVKVGAIGPELADKRSDVQTLEIPVLGESHRVVVLAKDEGGPVHVLTAAQETDRPGVVVDGIGYAGTTGMTMQRWRDELIDTQVRARDYDLVVTAWGANEMWIPDLDEETYRHHFGKTLARLRESAPAADCLVVTPLDRAPPKKASKGPAPSRALVTRVQGEVAASAGCAHFVYPTKLGPFPAARKDVAKVADLLVDDVLAWVDYVIVRREMQRREEEHAERARYALPPIRIDLDAPALSTAKPKAGGG